MAELEQGPQHSECCSTKAQATCCEPTDKAECCGDRAVADSCGCSAAARLEAVEIVGTHRVHERADSAIARAREPA
jgi:arsenite methyltransferase